MKGAFGTHCLTHRQGSLQVGNDDLLWESLSLRLAPQRWSTIDNEGSRLEGYGRTHRSRAARGGWTLPCSKKRAMTDQLEKCQD